MAFAFEKLLVCQKSVDFVDAICQRTEVFARGCGFFVDQLVDTFSSPSVLGTTITLTSATPACVASVFHAGCRTDVGY